MPIRKTQAVTLVLLFLFSNIARSQKQFTGLALIKQLQYNFLCSRERYADVDWFRYDYGNPTQKINQ
jgi:hypothetical protein